MTLSLAWAIARKDLRVELRGRYAMSSVLPFAATLLLASGFALGPGRALLEQAAPGLLWLAATFAAVEVFARSYAGESVDGALDGLLLAPVDKGAIYLGKTAAAAVQVLVTLVVTTLLVGVLFGLPVGAHPVLLGATVLLGVVGLSALGSLFGVLSVVGRTRQAALPVLVLPLVTPVLIAAIRSTSVLGLGQTGGVAGWLGLLVCFDAAFLAVGFLMFGQLLEN